MTQSLTLELATMATASERQPRPVGPLRRMPRTAVIAIAAGILLGGAGAAAAVTMDEWAPWAQAPDGTFRYTLPSGAQCEQRFGKIQGKVGKVEPVAEAIRAYLDRVDILQVADIDGALTEIRSGGNVLVLPNGSHEPSGYGTEHYNADQEYQQAVNQAVSEAITLELQRQGFDLEREGLNLSFEGEAHCPGAVW